MKRTMLTVLLFVSFSLWTHAQVLTKIDDVAPLQEDLVGVKKGDAWGFINTDGELVIDYRNDVVSTSAHYPVFNDAASDFETLQLFEDDCVFLLYTSGTTGFPKGVKYTHKMLFWNSINTAISLIINTETNTVNVMPPFHTGGWNVLVNPVLHHGGYVCLCRRFDAKTVNDLIYTEKVSVFMGVPTMLQMMALE